MLYNIEDNDELKIFPFIENEGLICENNMMF
jgi:hypothetical protein